MFINFRTIDSPIVMKTPCTECWPSLKTAHHVKIEKLCIPHLQVATSTPRCRDCSADGLSTVPLLRWSAALSCVENPNCSVPDTDGVDLLRLARPRLAGDLWAVSLLEVLGRWLDSPSPGTGSQGAFLLAVPRVVTFLHPLPTATLTLLTTRWTVAVPHSPNLGHNLPSSPVPPLSRWKLGVSDCFARPEMYIRVSCSPSRGLLCGASWLSGGERDVQARDRGFDPRLG